MPDPTTTAASATPVRPAAVPAAVPPPPPGPAAGRRVLGRMLDRLFAAVVNGPSMNCRPHRSRQRIDWSWLAVLGDATPADALKQLLGEDRKTVLRSRIAAPVPASARSSDGGADVADAGVLTDQPAEREAEPAAQPSTAGGGPAARRRVEDFFGGESEPGRGGESPPDTAEAAMLQAALFQKLHTIAEDARTYEQDTGVQVLDVGFPLLSLPPAFVSAAEGRQVSRRVLAPIAFVPVSLVIRRGATRTVELSCRGDGVDLVRPNAALLTWLQRQTGRPVGPASELFADEKGQDPWREVTELVARVCAMVDLPVPDEFKSAAPDPHEASEPARACRPGRFVRRGAERRARRRRNRPSVRPARVAVRSRRSRAGVRPATRVPIRRTGRRRPDRAGRGARAVPDDQPGVAARHAGDGGRARQPDRPDRRLPPRR
jgi:hypothetical protein